jgi:hypothetical protein
LASQPTDDRTAIAPRSGLRVRIVGSRGDLVDDGGHFQDAYGLSPGQWVLIRPDGYVGAIVGTEEIPALDRYLADVGVFQVGGPGEPAEWDRSRKNRCREFPQ